MIRNYGFFISIAIFLFQVVFMVMYIHSGFKSIVVGLNKYPLPSSPTTVSSSTENTEDSYKGLTFGVIVKTKQQEITLINEKSNNNLKEITDIKLEEISKEDYDDIMNSPYNQAEIYDKRNFLSILFTLLISKIDIITIIFLRGEFEIFPICFSTFTLSITIELTLNSILFSDDIISKKYNNGGSVSPFISFSLSLLSSFLAAQSAAIISRSVSYSVALDYLVNDEKDKAIFIKKCNVCLRYVKCKLAIYFIFQMVLTLFCIFFNSVFCTVYQNSQLNWLTDFIIGVVSSLIESLCVSFTVSLLRYIGLNYKIEKVYNISIYINTIL